MGLCTIEVISGCRRKRSTGSVDESHNTNENFGERGQEEGVQKSSSSRGRRKRGCLFVISFILILLGFSPVAIRGSSLDPNNQVQIATRSQTPHSPATNSLPPFPSSFFNLSSSPSASLVASTTATTTVAVDSVTTKYYPSSSSSASTSSGRVIRSSSTHSVAEVTEPIRVTASVPVHRRGHRIHNNHHEGVHPKHSRTRERQQEAQKPEPRTLQDICAAWEEKGCRCTGTAAEIQLNCHAVPLDELPLDLPENLVKLDLSATNISILLNNAFANLHHLEELSLAENQLTNIERNSFNGLTKLKRLVLSNCRLTRIPGESFKHLNSLHTLRLDRNEIEHLDGDSFQFVPNLRKLGLNHNHINTFPRQILATFASSLELLNLANNRITLIDENDFPRMDQLAVIILKRNRISKVSDGAFRYLPKLKILDLDDNFLTGIPNEFRTLISLQELSVSNNKIHYILDMDLPRSLTSFEVRANPLRNIQSRAFKNFTVLRKIVLSDAKNLVELPSFDGSPGIEILRVDRASLTHIPESLCQTSPRLKSLELKSNKLERVPSLADCARLRVLDLSGNRIRSLDGQLFKDQGELHDLVLSYNEIGELRRDTFTGLAVLQSLDLEGNKIERIESDTFAVFDRLEDLNLGNNVFPVLPTEGLQKLLHLKTFNNPKLREFPPPKTFPRIQTLVLSYAYHCCAFQALVASNSMDGLHDIQESIIFPSDTDSDFDLTLWNSSLPDFWPRWQNISPKFGSEVNKLMKKYEDVTYPVNMAAYVEEYLDEEGSKGFFGSSGSAEHTGYGDDQYRGSIQCLPLPGPFLPCTDLFDWWTLRCGVWVVFLLAMLGNGTVVFVLVFSRSKMDVPRFLVCNLAAADFFMGVYLGILAVVDASTLGEFRMFAIPWQMSAGCQLAGFLAVLSSELSVYTLAVITLERNYAITHAMHLNKRLSLRHAGYIMTIGWAFALTMAILPVFGISDYRKFAVCLPFETTTGPGSLAYVIFLMVINGVAFLILMGCYLKMYCAIRGSQAWNSNDSRIAKRMALLVFTDFLCWSPIAFFSLTAAFGLHLISLEQAKVFTVFILPLNSCCNPFLYAILTKQFKKDCVMICKAIEESRVTRGIGRCRHSSNFSNRHTPANTNSLVERSSKDAAPNLPGPPCGCTKLLDKPLDKHKFTGTHHNHHHFHHSFDNHHHHNHHHFHNHHGEEDLDHSEYRYPDPIHEATKFQKFWRRLFKRKKHTDIHRRNNRGNEYAYQIAEIQHKQQHKRAGSMSSSENFSSSRSDSWRHGPPHHHCGVPLRLLDPRRRHSSWLIRKTSQDSNLSSSRNDSSSTTATTTSTSTFRLSRSSGASTPLPPLIVPSRNSIPGCGGKPRLIRQPAMHEELSIDMSSSSPPRLGVRFLPTIPSAADSSIILDETDSGNDNSAELLSRQLSDESDGLILIASSHVGDQRQEDEEQQLHFHGEAEEGRNDGGSNWVSGDSKNPLRQANCEEIVVNLAEAEEYEEDDEDDDEEDEDALEMRLGMTAAETSEDSGRNEKRGSSDSTAGMYQAFYTVLGNSGTTLATLASPKDGDRPP